jgi:hypothetical protein
MFFSVKGKQPRVAQTQQRSKYGVNQSLFELFAVLVRDQHIKQLQASPVKRCRRRLLGRRSRGLVR